MAAVAAAKGGDTILLAPGQYDGLWFQSLNFSSAVTIASADVNNKAVVTGFEIHDSSFLTFQDLNLFAADPTGYYEFGADHSHDITFNRNFVHGSLDGNPQNDAEGIGFGNNSYNITITNNEITELRRGIAGSDTINTVIAGNYIHNVQTTGMSFGDMTGLQILNNYITEFHIAVGDHPDAIQFMMSGQPTYTSNVLISGNVITRGNNAQPAQGIFLRDESLIHPYQNISITNNFLLGTGYNGIAVIDGLINGNITGNELYSLDMNTNLTWLLVQGGTNVNIANNKSALVSATGVTGLTNVNNSIIAPTTDAGSAELNAWLLLHPEMAWVLNPSSATGGSTSGSTGSASGGSTGGTTTPPPPPPPPPVVTSPPPPPTNLNLDPTTDTGAVGDAITKSAIVRIDGTVSEGGSTITLLSDGAVVGTAIADSTGHFNVASSTLADGKHALKTMAKSSGGVTSSASDAIDVTVDTHAPNSDLIDFSMNRGPKNETVTLSGHAVDDSAGAVSVGIYRDGVLIKTVADTGGGWSYSDTTNLNAHTYTVKATDVAGNVSSNGDALIIGSAGNDNLRGTSGNDFIWSAGGYDSMSGGAGSDTFVFRSVSDAPLAAFNKSGKMTAVEQITDFGAGDKIDLSGVGHLIFDGQSSTAHRGAVDWYVTGGNTYVIADVNGDGRADMTIQLSGVHQLTASDFLLG